MRCPRLRTASSTSTDLWEDRLSCISSLHNAGFAFALYVSSTRLTKGAVSCRGGAWLLRDSSPNSGLCQQSRQTRSNGWIPSLHSQNICKLEGAPVIIIRLPYLHPSRGRALLTVCCIEMQPKLVCIYEMLPRKTIHSDRPRLIPENLTLK